MLLHVEIQKTRVVFLYKLFIITTLNATSTLGALNNKYYRVVMYMYKQLYKNTKILVEIDE